MVSRGGLADGFSARSVGQGGRTGQTRGGGDGHIYLPVLATSLIWRWTRQKRARIEAGLGVGEPCVGGGGGGRSKGDGTLGWPRVGGG